MAQKEAFNFVDVFPTCRSGDVSVFVADGFLRRVYVANSVKAARQTFRKELKNGQFTYEFHIKQSQPDSKERAQLDEKQQLRMQNIMQRYSDVDTDPNSRHLDGTFQVDQHGKQLISMKFMRYLTRKQPIRVKVSLPKRTSSVDAWLTIDSIDALSRHEMTSLAPVATPAPSDGRNSSLLQELRSVVSSAIVLPCNFAKAIEGSERQKNNNILLALENCVQGKEVLTGLINKYKERVKWATHCGDDGAITVLTTRRMGGGETRHATFKFPF